MTPAMDGLYEMTARVETAREAATGAKELGTKTLRGRTGHGSVAMAKMPLAGGGPGPVAHRPVLRQDLPVQAAAQAQAQVQVILPATERRREGSFNLDYCSFIVQ